MSSSGEAPTADGRNRRLGGGPGDRSRHPAVPARAPRRRPRSRSGSRSRSCWSSWACWRWPGSLYYLHARNFEDTDDAQIDGNISNIGPRVTGTVTGVHVVENQPVKAGDVLLEIDPTDLAVAVAQAKAAVAQAQAQLQAEDPTVSITETSNTAAVAGADVGAAVGDARALTGAEKDVEQLTARLAEAEGNARLAEIERKRGEELWKAQAIPRADFDRRVTAAETARRAGAGGAAGAGGGARAGARSRRRSSAPPRAASPRCRRTRRGRSRRARRRSSVAAGEPGAGQGAARPGGAEPRLRAGAQRRSPGIVAKKAVNVGDHVSPGQQLVAVAQTDDAVGHRQLPRDAARADAAGAGRSTSTSTRSASDLTGKVESIGGATGSRLSVLPPENASGNYVKVVQRIPVRIRIDPGQAGIDRLRPGMSVEPEGPRDAVSAGRPGGGGAGAPRLLRRPAGPAATTRGPSRSSSRWRRSWRCSTPASPTSRCRTSPATSRSARTRAPGC